MEKKIKTFRKILMRLIIKIKNRKTSKKKNKDLQEKLDEVNNDKEE